MENPVRNAAVALGLILLGYVLVAMMQRSKPTSVGNESKGDSSARQGELGETGNTFGEPRDGGGTSHHETELDRTRRGQRAVEPPEKSESGIPRKTKSEGRPGDAELARQRLERHRLELVENLREFKEAGLASRHPSVVRATADLEKIEAEQAAAGEGGKPAN